MRVIRTQRELSRKPNLSQIELSGNPTTIAAELVEIGNRQPRPVPIGAPRASSLFQACMRLRILGTVYKKKMTELDSIHARVTFGIGNSLHYWVQNTDLFLGDRRRGWWKCVACGRTRYFGAPPKKGCEFCKASPAATIYEEHGIDLKKPYPVTGHPDMFYAKKPDLVRVLEIKTLNGDDWQKLKSPLVEHEWQLQTYMWACSIDPDMPAEIDPLVGYILYFSKMNFRNSLPVKAFVVVKNDSLLKRIFAKLGVYRAGVVDGELGSLPPILDECVRSKFKGARSLYCPVRGECQDHG